MFTRAIFTTEITARLKELLKSEMNYRQITNVLNSEFNMNYMPSQVQQKVYHANTRHNKQFGRVYKKKKLDITDIVNWLRTNLLPIGGTNLISQKNIERKVRIDTTFDFTQAHITKAIDALVIEGRLIRKSDTMFIICAPRVEGFKTVGEVAQAIHKALEARHAA